MNRVKTPYNAFEEQNITNIHRVKNNKLTV